MVIPFVLSILVPFGIILSVILITSSIGTEYNWRTIRTILICSESRFKLLGAKLIAVGILMLIGVVVGLAAGFIMSLITTASADMHLTSASPLAGTFGTSFFSSGVHFTC